jgi:hypothetical protein
VRTLVTELVKAGAVGTVNEPRARLLLDERVPLVDDRTMALAAQAIAMEHVGLHGIQMEEPLCPRWPCRVGGIAFALFEVADYQCQKPDTYGGIEAARGFAELAMSLRRAIARARTASRKLADHGHELDRSESLEWHQHEVMCVRPARLLDRLSEVVDPLADDALALERDLLGLVWSAELQQPRGRKPTKCLLTAVYQHLRWGGLPWHRIAILVPDGGGTRGAAMRVRKRAAGPDLRLVRPFRPDGKNGAPVDISS